LAPKEQAITHTTLARLANKSSTSRREEAKRMTAKQPKRQADMEKREKREKRERRRRKTGEGISDRKR